VWQAADGMGGWGVCSKPSCCMARGLRLRAASPRALRTMTTTTTRRMDEGLPRLKLCKLFVWMWVRVGFCFLYKRGRRRP
jgi:hypothetical protein